MTAVWRLFYLQYVAQKWSGPTDAVARDFFRRAGGDNLAAIRTRFRSDIDDVISFGDDAEIVLDHDDGVALIHEAMQHIEQQLHIRHVQTDRRFLEKIERRFRLAHFANALVLRSSDAARQFGCELKSLRFATA